MSHELFGERFFGRREPAWHGLGTVFTDNPSPIEAIGRADLDYNIIKAPLMVDLDGVQTSFGRVAIVREPTHDDSQYRVFGDAQENYTVLQNREIAEIVNPLADRWPLETIGALHNGATLFLTLDAGESEINGDPIHNYFMVADKRDGGTAFDIAFTPIRVVCQNTLEAGKAAAVASASLRHTESLREEVEWRVELLEQMQQVMEKVNAGFEMMANAVLTPEGINRVIEVSYPYPRKPKKVRLADELEPGELERVGGLLDAVRIAERDYETSCQRADERRNVVRELFGTFNDEQPSLANTSWAVYNAVVEFEDYRKTQGREDPLVSALFGDRAKVKRWAYGEARKQAEKVVVR
jgi:phage/plasmid-like protein (TIGR03299 family)